MGTWQTRTETLRIRQKRSTRDLEYIRLVGVRPPNYTLEADVIWRTRRPRRAPELCHVSVRFVGELYLIVPADTDTDTDRA